MQFERVIRDLRSEMAPEDRKNDLNFTKNVLWQFRLEV